MDTSFKKSDRQRWSDWLRSLAKQTGHDYWQVPPQFAGFIGCCRGNPQPAIRRNESGELVCSGHENVIVGGDTTAVCH